MKQIKDEKQRNNEVVALLFHGPGILQEEEEDEREIQEISKMMNEEEDQEASETVDLL